MKGKSQAPKDFAGAPRLDIALTRSRAQASLMEPAHRIGGDCV
jgi:hypothetical protein